MEITALILWPTATTTTKAALLKKTLLPFFCHEHRVEKWAQSVKDRSGGSTDVKRISPVSRSGKDVAQGEQLVVTWGFKFAPFQIVWLPMLCGLREGGHTCQVQFPDHFKVEQVIFQAHFTSLDFFVYKGKQHWSLTGLPLSLEIFSAVRPKCWSEKYSNVLYSVMKR